MNEIGIGTAQFGLKYGINRKKTRISEIKKIVLKAELKGVKFIDSSPVYGNSENVIGDILKSNHSFKIISKTISLDGRKINQKLIEDVKKNFYSSLKNLKQKRIHALLIHNSEDLFQENSELLYKEIKNLKDNKLITKIGVSVYRKHEIERILSYYDFDIFQIPCNILDQRLIFDGTLEALYKKNIEMHARSVFLQGLLLMEVKKIPNYFHPIYKKLLLWNRRLKINNISPVEGALSFIVNLKKFKSIIVGFNDYSQFEEVSNCKFLKLPFPTKDLICLNEKYVDPRNWRKF